MTREPTTFDPIDVLWLAALPIELSAAQDVLSDTANGSGSVSAWTAVNDVTAPYIRGTYVTASGGSFSIALARPLRMGGESTSPIAAMLADRLRPSCIVMSGVCAGHPGELALGDVVASELTYNHEEGKVDKEGFRPDLRQSAVPPDWVRAAQDLKASTLASYGPATAEDARFWLLERLYGGAQPAAHPALNRYFPSGEFATVAKSLEAERLIKRIGKIFELTSNGRDAVEESLAYDVDPPARLPFEIRVGPIASGAVVVKDGMTWDRLRREGVRSVIGLEMEAAAVGQVARATGVNDWIVIKGVMDHADPNKDDRFKAFAARASAEVTELFLAERFATRLRPERPSIDAAFRPPSPLPSPSSSASGSSDWRPRSPADPFFDNVRTALVSAAPPFVGVFDLARAVALEAYAAADRAHLVASEIRRLVDAPLRVEDLERSQAKKIVKVVHRDGDRALMVKLLDSGDEYVGEGTVDGREFGLGVDKIYALSQVATPNQVSAFAGQHEGLYGPLGVFTFESGAQFAGKWTDGRPVRGYREMFGELEEDEFDFYLGQFGTRIGPEGKYRPHWLYDGDGVGVRVQQRLIVCGRFQLGRLIREHRRSPISF